MSEEKRLSCNMPAPSGARRAYCGGESVFEAMEQLRSGQYCVFRYCLNHLRDRVEVGLLKGDTE